MYSYNIIRQSWSKKLMALNSSLNTNSSLRVSTSKRCTKTTLARPKSTTNKTNKTNKRTNSSTTTTTTTETPPPPPPPTIELPTQTQLQNHYIANGLPMVGFGIMDQTVMIQAGNAIDCTIGVQLGLSTLTAAAVGGLISNLSGVLFGGTLENIAKTWGGLSSSGLTSAQRNLTFVKRNRLLSQAFGIFLGCCIGLMNLLFIDTERSQELKFLNMSEEEEFAFEVEVSNEVNDDATVLVVKGPDLDGILASVTAALSLNGCSLLEVTAHTNGNTDDDKKAIIQDTFFIKDPKTKQKIPDDELENLAKVVLEATREGPNLLKHRMKELEDKNQALLNRVNSLEGTLMKRRMSVKPSGKGIVRG